VIMIDNRACLWISVACIRDPLICKVFAVGGAEWQSWEHRGAGVLILPVDLLMAAF